MDDENEVVVHANLLCVFPEVRFTKAEVGKLKKSKSNYGELVGGGSIQWPQLGFQTRSQNYRNLVEVILEGLCTARFSMHSPTRVAILESYKFPFEGTTELGVKISGPEDPAAQTNSASAALSSPLPSLSLTDLPTHSNPPIFFIPSPVNTIPTATHPTHHQEEV